MASDSARELEEMTELMDAEEIVNLLCESTWEGKWDRVVQIYRKFPWTHNRKISNSSGDTALHAAVDSGQEDTAELLVKVIVEHEEKLDAVESSLQQRQQLDMTKANIIPESEKFQEKLDERAQVKALTIQNVSGDTPLHLAALKGFVKVCKCIVGLDPSKVLDEETFTRGYLQIIRNEEGETPIFLAALNWHKESFVYLMDISMRDFKGREQLTRNNGDTILHCAIQREYFDLAVIILKYYGNLLMGSINKEGYIPLAVLATKCSAFLSSTNLSRWDQILYRCIPVKPLDVESALSKIRGRVVLEASHHPNNWPINILLRLGRNIVFRKETEPDIEGEPRVVPPVHAIWYGRTIWLQIVTFLYAILTGTIRVKRKKQKHLWGAQILNELMKRPSMSYRREYVEALFPTNTEAPAMDKTETKLTEKKETALLVAASNGVVEIVIKILTNLPVTIQEKNSKKRNVLLVAVHNRQPLIVKALSTHSLWYNLLLGVDKNENTVLHLAAEAINVHKPWKIPGAAMQMIWDIKWYEYIKSLVPPHFHLRSNKDHKTPGEIFNTTHTQLVKESSEWLKDTSESCSVVAALIAGVSFATSSTVPGGTDSETGKPALEGQPAFDLFAMTSLVSLCFSVTALIMFLSILTSRKQAKDFHKDLPIKILLGLSSLFVSIASMFTSFCAGHFFVLRDKFKNTLFPIYAATCLPVTFYAVAQLPLYIDLLAAIVGKVPRPRDMGDDL